MKKYIVFVITLNVSSKHCNSNKCQSHRQTIFKLILKYYIIFQIYDCIIVLYEYFISSSKYDILPNFWFYTQNKIYTFIVDGIGLITNEEVKISTISQEMAEEFMKHEVEDVEAEFIIDDDDPVSFFSN